MAKRKVFSIDFQLYKVTGVEKVMLNIHHAIQDEYEAKIVGNIPYYKIRKEHRILDCEYLQFKNFFMFRNSIVIVHERRLLLLFWLLNHLLFQNIKIIYVHHSLFYNHKLTTLLPKTIVAIADKGIENLTQFFGAPISSIIKIYNCVDDDYDHPHAPMNRKNITLILPGRINYMKRQVEIVQQLAGKIDPHIKILFVGDGPQLDELRTSCEDKDNFVVLGFRDDVKELLRKADYMLLYSVQEGLPITLIEATMIGMPIICNDVGGNKEICHHGKNGWVINNWDDLVYTLNNLHNVTSEEYIMMCKESRRIYKENFTFEIFKQKYLNLLSSMR